MKITIEIGPNKVTRAVGNTVQRIKEKVSGITWKRSRKSTNSRKGENLGSTEIQTV